LAIGAFFVLKIRQKGDIMAKAKYTPDKNGVFSTLAWDGTYTDSGEKRRKQLRSKKSSKDLENIVNAFKQKVEERSFLQQTDLLFTVYAKMWAETYKAKAELNTKSMYENALVHFKQLNGIRLGNIERVHLQSILNSVTASVGEKVYITFKQIIKSAIVDRYLPPIILSDIFDNIVKPKPPKSEKRALTIYEKEALKIANFKLMDMAFVYIIYGCGLRRGETLALSIFDIDFKSNEISITKTIVFDKNDPHIKNSPKSQNGVRKVPMPAFLSSFLKKYTKSLQKPQLFSTRGKELMTKSSFDTMWERIRKEMNTAAGGKDELQVVYGLTAHVFRHNYCSSLCYQIPTISIKRIAQLLGDSEKMVLEVYNHIMLEKEDVQTAISEAINF
jgi:Site-specific recombinase XerD